MAIKTLRVFAEYTSTGFVPMPVAGGIDYGYTLANTFPSTQPSTFQTDDPDLDVTVTAMTDFYVWIRISGTAWNPSYTRNVRVYPDSPDINSVVMNMIIATGPAGVSSYSQIVQTANRLYFNGATTDSVYNSKFAGKTYINELNFGTAPQLATVATSGAYADLTGKPALATVATSGSYADLSSKPSGTAPISYNSGTNSFQITQANSTTNGFLTSTDWNTFNNKYLLPTGGTTAQYLRGDGTLATFPTTLDSTRLILNGRNTTGTTLAKGTVVYINGVQGNTPLFARAIASADSTSAQTLGVVEFDIPNNSNGVVVLVGAVNNLDTSSYTEGVQLYLSGTTAGAFTSSKILAPTHLVYVGIVTRAHPTLGVVEVKIQNGYELDEIHDVAAQTPANNDGLFFESSTNLWKNKSIPTVLGYTPYNASNPSNYIALTALSASAPLSYNNTTGAFSIAQANGSTNGFLSSTDWTTFNSKQNALTIGNVSEVSSNVLMFPDGGIGKTIGNLSIQVVQAGATTNGYLSSTDWTTFNNKQGTITLTTTGTSGAATFSANTLNIPQYVTDLSGLVTLTTTQTISGAKTFSSVLNGTSGIFGSDFLTNETSKVGISFGGGYGQINAWGANTSTYGGLRFQLSASNGGTFNALTIVPSGNIGIGTTAPTGTYGKLSVAGGISILNDNNAKLEIGRYASFAPNSYIKLGANSDSLRITNNTDAADLVTFTNSGNVGIGTTSTNEALSIVRPANSASYLSVFSGTSYVLFGVDSAGLPRIYTDSNPISFWTNATERMRITSGGNVGIGTTTAPQRLTISDTNSAKILLTGGSSQNGILFGPLGAPGGNAPEFYLYNGNTNNAPGFSLYDNSNGVWRFTITNGGNMLLGTTSDNGERLYVSGAIRATGNITANSDLTLKKNLQLIDNPIDKLMSLNGYLYQWKENDEYQYGVIAQEVEKVMSYAVQTGNNGIKGVAYNQLTPLLIEGFKLHNQKIDLHTSEITQLKNEVQYLKAKLA